MACTEKQSQKKSPFFEQLQFNAMFLKILPSQHDSDLTKAFWGFWILAWKLNTHRLMNHCNNKGVYTQKIPVVSLVVNFYKRTIS